MGADTPTLEPGFHPDDGGSAREGDAVSGNAQWRQPADRIAELSGLLSRNAGPVQGTTRRRTFPSLRQSAIGATALRPQFGRRAIGGGGENLRLAGGRRTTQEIIVG